MTHTSRLQEPTLHGGYIPGIEGMRSLAVLAVLFFHLDLHALSGGYLGVDLFFVISGFIITRNILFDLEGGEFTLRGFYVRRFRRLFPALVVTVFATIAVAPAIMTPSELSSTAESAIYALFSLANFHFWLDSGYFDAAAESKPLLHTWSLSVEEQFYLFWPTLLLLLKPTGRRALIVILLLATSLIAALLLRGDYADAVFYLVPFRLHQLMAGALIAILSLRLSGKLGSLGVLLATIGFVGLVMSFDERFSPAVGATLVTGFGSVLLLGRETPLVQRIYGNRPMQWIGRRSYAIYLVHWPIVVLYQYANGFELSGVDRLLVLAGTITAAIALHELVENPFRKRGEDTSTAQKTAAPAIFLALLVTVTLAGTIWKLDGLAERFDREIQSVVDSVDWEIKNRKAAIRFGQCNLHKEHSFSDYDIEECATTVGNQLNVLILGDSMGADSYLVFSQAYPEIRFLQATAGACTGLVTGPDAGGKYSSCLALNQYRFNELLEQDIDLVVLSSVWGDTRIPPLEATVSYLQSRGERVLVVGPKTIFTGGVPILIAQQSSLQEVNPSIQDRVKKDDALLAKLRAALPGVKVLDLAALQCNPQCDVLEGDRLLYYDGIHFTELGARRVGERLRESFDLAAYINSPADDTR